MALFYTYRAFLSSAGDIKNCDKERRDAIKSASLLCKMPYMTKKAAFYTNFLQIF
jgi:hypothetical protein